MQHIANEQAIIIDNYNLTYYDEGKGETVILLHGWPQTSYVWRKIFPKLKTKYRVIAIDLPGLGKSDAVDKYDTENISILLNQFVLKLNINQFHLVGHDIGGWIATAYAIKYENKLKTLTVLDAGIPGLMPSQIFQPENANKIWQFYFHSVEDLPEFLIKGKEKEYLAWYFSKKSVIKDAINEADLMEYTHHYKRKMKNGFDYYRAFPLSAEQNKNFKSKLALPILAIGGKTAMAANVGLGLQNIANNITNIVIEDCGHYIPEEQPNQLIDILKQFID